MNLYTSPVLKSVNTLQAPALTSVYATYITNPTKSSYLLYQDKSTCQSQLFRFLS